MRHSGRYCNRYRKKYCHRVGTVRKYPQLTRQVAHYSNNRTNKTWTIRTPNTGTNPGRIPDLGTSGEHTERRTPNAGRRTPADDRQVIGGQVRQVSGSVARSPKIGTHYTPAPAGSPVPSPTTDNTRRTSESLPTYPRGARIGAPGGPPPPPRWRVVRQMPHRSGGTRVRFADHLTLGY